MTAVDEDKELSLIRKFLGTVCNVNGIEHCCYQHNFVGHVSLISSYGR